MAGGEGKHGWLERKACLTRMKNWAATTGRRTNQCDFAVGRRSPPANQALRQLSNLSFVQRSSTILPTTNNESRPLDVCLPVIV